MAQTPINGTDIVILIDRTGGGTFTPLGCLKSNSLKSSITELDASSKCNPAGLWIPGSKIEQTLSGECLAMDQDGANTLNSYTQAYNLHIQSATFAIKFGKVIPTTGDAVFAGTAYISSIDLVSPYNDLVTFNITFRITAPAMVQTVSY